MTLPVNQTRRRFDGIYRTVKKEVVYEYSKHPVRFVTILLSLIVLIGVLANFNQVVASIELYSNQRALQNKYPNYWTLADQTKVSHESDKYFTGDHAVVPSDSPVDVTLPSSSKNIVVTADSANKNVVNASSQFAKSVDVTQSQTEATVTQDSTSGQAGLYEIKAQDKATGATLADKTVAWGVLAFNPDYSVYAPNSDAVLAMAVLDDRGKVVCDASMNIDITNPNGKVVTPSTDNKLILVNEACLVYGATSEPDYIANYQTSVPGTYKVTMTAQLGGGTRVLQDEFMVKDNQPFYLQRVGTTRTYPGADYVYDLNFQPKVNGSYQLTETVPAEFNISDTRAQITTVGDVKKLVWQINAKEGVDQTLSYSFKGPYLSPHLYNLGPATVGNTGAKLADSSTVNNTVFTEPRMWQIASDSLTSPTWTGAVNNLWSNPGNWSTGTVPNAGDNLVFPSGALNPATYNDLDDNTMFNSITFTGSGYTVTGDNLILGQGVSGITDSATSGGNIIGLNIRVDVTRDIFVTNSGETLTIVGNIAGVGGINKEGLGTLALSGANTYGGTLKVNAGILSAQNSRALGTIAAGTIVAGGAELTLQGNISIGYEPLTLAGYGVGGAGALVNVSDSNAYAGLITLINTTQINSNSGTLTLAGGVTGGYQLVFDGSSNITFTTTAIAIGGSPVTKNGSGTLTYNFPNTYTGLTTVNAGTLQYGVNDALATGGLTVTAGTVNIGSYSDNVGAVTVGTLDNAVGTITGSTGVLTSTSYTINAGTISAIIAGQGVSVTKNTPFTGVLTRANLFSGGVIIQGGILKIQNGGALGLIDGATSVAAGSTLQIDGSGLTIPNYISVYGTGMYFAGAIWNSSGSNTISGLITLGAAAQLDADSGTTLTVDGKGISAATYALTFDGGGNFTFTSTAPIYGTTAALVMSASGTLTVQSFSDYTGTTTVNTGAMVLRACLESFKYQRDKGQHDHLEAGC